jgi:hypothetical protein
MDWYAYDQRVEETCEAEPLPDYVREPVAPRVLDTSGAIRLMTHSFSYYDQMVRQQRDALFLYVDIETIPSRDPDVIRAIIAKHATEPLDESTIKPAANLKDPAKIAEDMERRIDKARQDQIEKVKKAGLAVDEEYRRTALDASTGHIACVSVALADGPVVYVSSGALVGYDIQSPPDLESVLTGEREMLEDLFTGIETMLRDHAIASAEKAWDNMRRESMGGREVEIIKNGDYIRPLPEGGRDAWVKANTHLHVPVVVAHHAGFDVRFIWQRAIVLGVTPPSWWPIDARPWDSDRIYDTMTAWAGHGNRIGLDRLCRALGLPGKTGVDGSQV